MLAGLGLLVLSRCGLGGEPVEAQRPSNTLFILVDDLGPEWISACGGEEMTTPNVDRLAERSMLFTNAYSMWLLFLLRMPGPGTTQRRLNPGISNRKAWTSSDQGQEPRRGVLRFLRGAVIMTADAIQGAVRITQCDASDTSRHEGVARLMPIRRLTTRAQRLTEGKGK